MASFLETLRAEFASSTPSKKKQKAALHSPLKDALKSSSLDAKLAVWKQQYPNFRSPFDQDNDQDDPVYELLRLDHADLEQERQDAAYDAYGVSAAAVCTKKKHKTPNKSTKSSSNAMEERLLDACAQYTALPSVPDGVFTPIELSKTIFQTLFDHQYDLESMQAHLFSLLGVDGMELIGFSMQHVSDITSSVTIASLEKTQRQRDAMISMNHQPQQPFASFSIQTATEQLMRKQQRKANRKKGPMKQEEEETNWLEAAGYDPEVLRLQRQLMQEEARNQSTSLLHQEFGVLDGGYDTTGAAGQLTSAGMTTLPESTKRTFHKGYEHVFIPAHAKKPLAKHETLVSISQLEPFAQSAFQGIKQLNRLQSKLFQAAYHTNQNLLVCAPTGAGKTNVAMLTILQQVKSHLHRKKELKIIYVAPMKALAQEVVTKFGKRLEKLELKVAECTGDMQLTKKEIEETNVIVTTPEKWDVITRKSSAQQALLSQVKLLIIDEVHLLADERGPVIETIVARTLRRVESTQSMIRIVGLSATLPNYADVASFLRVSVPPGDAKMQNAAVNGGKGGLFFFDASYRPVPLDQTFIGVKTTASLKDALGLSSTELMQTTEKDDSDDKFKRMTSANNTMSKQRQIQLMMNKLTLAHALQQVRNQEQVMVFVHSRKETAATIRQLMELASQDDDPTALEAFQPPELVAEMPLALRQRIERSRNRELKEFLSSGFGIHHAGMLRSDRNLTEELFERGYIRLLCCTATLAWGVNLPAHSVVIKGTQVYNADKGGITQLSMLDVMQIFGRAGRPQYDSSGDAVLITTHDQLPHYLRLLTNGVPMESALIKALPDHLNAEIVSGTVSNLEEACEWLSYTYLYVRMRKNPLAYGMKLEETQQDPLLRQRRKQLLLDAAEKLQNCRMIKILREKVDLNHVEHDDKIMFAVHSMGRVASHYYISHASIQTFNELLDTKKEDNLSWEKVLLVLCSSAEFEQIRSREEEMTELEKLRKQFARFDVLGGGLESFMGKTNVLLQALISKARVSSFTLISDTNYIAQNASRVCRALFEISLKKLSSERALKFLQMAKAIDQQVWMDQIPLLQLRNVPMEAIAQVQQHHVDVYDVLVEEESQSFNFLSAKTRRWIHMLPYVDVDQVMVQPFGSSKSKMIKLSFSLYPLWKEWNEKVVGSKTLHYWIWIEDALSGAIYHHEYFVLHQSQYLRWSEGAETLAIECFLPVFTSPKRPEAEYVIRVLSDQFIGAETYHEVVYAPENDDSASKSSELCTKLLRLHPQPIQSLANPAFEALYASSFQSFNAIQTQCFHQLYHHDTSLLLCAPSGSGKTICAELAMLRLWTTSPQQLIVYVTPLATVARTRTRQWKARFACLRKRTVEVSEETVVSMDSLHQKADLVVMTPEKLDRLMRSGAHYAQAFMKSIGLVVVDQLHLMSEVERGGSTLEMVIARLRRFAVLNGRSMRILGLSTTLANAHDVGQWLGIKEILNFDASARPHAIDVHLQGFPERHYVARMAAMNKPTYMAIKAYAPSNDQPVLIYVSSKAQTKFTALDLIAFSVAEGSNDANPKRFLAMDDRVLDDVHIQDETLRHTLAFGIGLYHPGLSRSDRQLVERLYQSRMIQVVLATSSMAWSSGLSKAHLVILKGTEQFEQGRYRPYPMSDVMEMIGHSQAIACVLVEEAKKNMMQRFLNEPVAIESSLLIGLELMNHLNAEIASSFVQKKADLTEVLSWTLLLPRMIQNPTYYGTTTDRKDMEAYVDTLITTALEQLQAFQCIEMSKSLGISSTALGQLACSLSLDVRTVSNLSNGLKEVASSLQNQKLSSDADVLSEVLAVLCESSVEMQATVTLRHHEAQSQWFLDLCKSRLPFPPLRHLFRRRPKSIKTLMETHGSTIKAFVLMQLYLKDQKLPSSDCFQDLKRLLELWVRLLRGLIAIASELKSLELVVMGIRVLQATIEAKWPLDEDQGKEQRVVDVSCCFKTKPSIAIQLTRKTNQTQWTPVKKSMMKPTPAGLFVLVVDQSSIVSVRHVRLQSQTLELPVPSAMTSAQVHVLPDGILQGGDQIIHVPVSSSAA